MKATVLRTLAVLVAVSALGLVGCSSDDHHHDRDHDHDRSDRDYRDHDRDHRR